MRSRAPAWASRSRPKKTISPRRCRGPGPGPRRSRRRPAPARRGAAGAGRCGRSRSCRRWCRSRRRSGTAPWVFEPLVMAAGQHQEVVGAELAAQLEPQGGAGGVAGQQRGGDAEAGVGLAVAVLDPQQRIELADEQRGLAESVSTHSTWARSRSMKSPRRNSFSCRRRRAGEPVGWSIVGGGFSDPAQSRTVGCPTTSRTAQ